VGGAKGVIDIDIAQSGEFFSEVLDGFGLTLDLLSFLVLDGSFLFGVESHVFTQKDLSFGVVDLVYHILSHTIFEESHWTIEVLFQMRNHGLE
jgi:hypothetical protein